MMLARSCRARGLFLCLAFWMLISSAGCGSIGGLLGFGGGPLGTIQFLATILRPPPSPIENEVIAAPFPVASFKFISDEALPIGITGTLLAQLDDTPNHAALGPDGRLYFTEKHTGRVRAFDLDTQTLAAAAVLDLAVNSSGSRGLIGIAFAPDGGRTFLTYYPSSTGADTSVESETIDARVVSYPFSNGAVTGGETTLFSTSVRDASFPSDINGLGPCLVGPDSALYFSHGDRNSRFSALDFNPSQPGGKLFRVNLDGSIPADNPSADSAFFATGFREITAMAFDSEVGHLWAADAAPGVSDELNLIEAGGYYGWPLVVGESNVDFESTVSGPLSLFFSYKGPFIDFAYLKMDPRGLLVNRGGAYGDQLEGDVVLGQSADSPSIIHRYHITDDFIIPHSVMFEVPETSGDVRTLAAGPDGRIYVLTETEIYRLDRS